MAIGFPTKANWAAGDVLTASQMDDLAGTVNTVQYLKPWNTVLNSNFSIWQRGTSFSGLNAASTSYGPDRYNIYTGNSAIVFSRQATADTTNLPFIQYCLRVTRPASNSSTTAAYVLQSFETVNSIPYAGKQVTFSFYARAGANYSAASSGLGVRVSSGTGTDQALANAFSGQVDFISQTATLTTTWQRFSYTGTVASNATQLGFQFTYTPVGTAGAADYYEITGVQLEQGSVANTFQPNQATYQAELAACQRYLPALVASGTGTYMALATSTTNSYATVTLPVTARVAPTGITIPALSNFQIINAAIAGGSATAVAFGSATVNQVLLQITTAAGNPTIVSGQGDLFQFNASAYILFTGCEL